jgi:hypothetical protein
MRNRFAAVLILDCARESDAPVAPDVTLDGRPLRISQVETGLMRLTLPADNIFGLPAGTKGMSVGHGWVNLHEPLRQGTHVITISGASSDPITTTIQVVRSCQ